MPSGCHGRPPGSAQSNRYELGILAATAAGKPTEACEIGKGVAKVVNASEMLRRIAVEACWKR
jgi:hypothetical protein